jgi:hypothetical protein
MLDDETENDDWKLWWDSRVAALEGVLGKSDDMVRHSPLPFELGAEVGGLADVVCFRNHIDGIIATTCDLIGNDDQLPNEQGNYELAIGQRVDDEWGPHIISQLAHYTFQAVLNPGETMEIGPATPEGSTIAAFLFCDYGRFQVRGRKAGLLLCIGLTATELAACLDGRRAEVESALKNAGVYPCTDLFRDSVL